MLGILRSIFHSTPNLNQIVAPSYHVYDGLDSKDGHGHKVEHAEGALVAGGRTVG